MGLLQIGASGLAALLVGVLARGLRSRRSMWRMYLLLALSILAVYWFQPIVPIRSFDFWLPSLSLALILLTWFITSQSGAWRSRQNLNGLMIIVGLATVIDLSRYFLPDPFITALWVDNLRRDYSFNCHPCHSQNSCTLFTSQYFLAYTCKSFCRKCNHIR